MCIMCSGEDRDDVLFHIDATIERFGWYIQGVVGHEPPALDWAYSIGLAQRFGHPELVVVGVEAEIAAEAINDLGEMVRSGRRLAPGSSVELADGDVAIGMVHSAHFETGLMAMWHEYYDKVGPPVPHLEALQVMFGCGSYCREHQNAVPRLSNPKARLEQAPPLVPNRGRRRHRRPR